ncbi:MAG: hypothetical protein M1824_003362, partial [Vezdaea acicularis]
MHLAYCTDWGGAESRVSRAVAGLVQGLAGRMETVAGMVDRGPRRAETRTPSDGEVEKPVADAASSGSAVGALCSKVGDGVVDVGEAARGEDDAVAMENRQRTAINI